MRLSAGHQIGHYTLNYALGQGGMAEVWAATNSILGIQVALKVMLRGNPVQQARLLREGRAQAALDHPNILPVRDVIDVNGSLGLILPLVQGPSLDRVLRNYRPSVDEAVALFRAIAEGVSHAHQRGLIHRDLKPANVLLEERWGRVIPRVADFGLVKGDADYTHTQTGVFMGTLQYVAPEQLTDAANVDHRADLFSLGVILVELLRGRRPFRARSPRDLLLNYENGPDLSGILEGFTPLCQALLSFEPSDRPADGVAVLAMLDGIHPLGHRSVLAADSIIAQAIRLATPQPPRSADLNGSVSAASGTYLSSGFHIKKAPPASPPHNNLPVEISTFIGRDVELAQLAEAVEDSRLVTVLGTGGMGKTALILHFAHQHLMAYPGGVFFCDLSEAHTIEGIVFVVSQALGASLGKGDPLQQLDQAVASRGRCLIILDNFEQLVAYAGETVERWLKRASDARFVVTSRALLEVEGELVYRLLPLALDAAIALFEDRARRKKRSFAVTDANREAVTQLVQQLDGLPLAIELACARIGMMKPSMMLKRMRNRFKLLATGKRNTAHRQATLRATIDWSWALLADWEKAAFAQSSVFEGGFTLEAAEVVIDLEFFEGGRLSDAPWPMDAVQSLVDKSLLRPLGENRVGEMRFGMLMSLQEYAREQLRPDDAKAARARHLAFYAQHGDVAEMDALLGAEGVSRWWALRLEADNLLAANRFAVSTDDVDGAARTALGLFIVAIRQQPTVALPALNAVTAMANSRERTPLYPYVLNSLGNLHNEQSRMADAERYFQEALDLFRARGERRSEGTALGNLANLSAAQGRMVQAERRYAQALEIHREVGDRRSEGRVLGNLGNLLRQRGQADLAEEHLKAALTIHRATGDRQNEGYVRGNLGNLCGSQGRMGEAEAHFQAALAITREVGEHRGEGFILGNLGNLYLQQGRLEDAQDHFVRALARTREVGARSFAGYVLGNLGETLARQGDMIGARERFEEGEQLLRKTRHALSLVSLLCQRATVEIRAGDTNRAREALDAARQRAMGLNAGPGSVLGQRIAAVQAILDEATA
ncbi:MAG: tetratricopeptide repeat protein [Myxococcota bacterium]